MPTNPDMTEPMTREELPTDEESLANFIYSIRSFDEAEAKAKLLWPMLGDAQRPLQSIHDAVNALGGSQYQDNSYDQAVVDTVAKVLEIIEKAQGAGVAQDAPSGWKLVPIEPTDAMVEVGCDNNPTQWNEGTDNGFAVDVANDVYVSMVRSAPAAPQQSPRLEREGKPPQTAAASPQNYHAMLASLREAFDGADVPQKNRALRRAYDALAAIPTLLSPDTTVVTSTSRAACHDHPTMRCTPDDCCQRVSSNLRGDGK